MSISDQAVKLNLTEVEGQVLLTVSIFVSQLPEVLEDPTTIRLPAWVTGYLRYVRQQVAIGTEFNRIRSWEPTVQTPTGLCTVRFQNTTQQVSQVMAAALPPPRPAPLIQAVWNDDDSSGEDSTPPRLSTTALPASAPYRPPFAQQRTGAQKPALRAQAPAFKPITNRSQMATLPKAADVDTTHVYETPEVIPGDQLVWCDVKKAAKIADQNDFSGLDKLGTFPWAAIKAYYDELSGTYGSHASVCKSCWSLAHPNMKHNCRNRGFMTPAMCKSCAKEATPAHTRSIEHMRSLALQYMGQNTECIIAE